MTVSGFGQLDAEGIRRVNHQPVNAGIAHSRIRITHDAKPRGDVAAGILLMVSQYGQSCYIHIFPGKNNLVHRRFSDHDWCLGILFAGSVFADEFRKCSVF